MRHKTFAGIGMLAYLALQIWNFHLIFNYPYLGLQLAKNAAGRWVIEACDPLGVAAKSGLVPGDLVESINGRPPGEHLTVRLWRLAEQVRDLAVIHDGHVLTYAVSRLGPEKSGLFFYNFDNLALFGSVLGLLLALLLYSKAQQNVSARLLSYVFLTMGAISMNLGGSLRGDPLAKNLIGSLMVLMPLVFLHFLVTFFREKGSVDLPFMGKRFFRFGYALFSALLVSHVLLFVPAWSFQMRMYTVPAVIFLFLVGILLNFYVLLFLYVRFRKKKNLYQRKLVQTVLISFFISFSPFSFLYFLPLLFGHDMVIDPYFSSWFIFLLPVSFAYLILSKQMYDIDLILRRALFASVLAFLPAAGITLYGMATYLNGSGYQKIAAQFFFIWLVLTVMFYSLEYYGTKLQKFMFPRKYLLQNSLEKIAKNLRSITSFREIKNIVLTDIVQTLQVFGGAVVFRYQHDMEIISEGAIDAEEVKRLIEAEVREHPQYSILEINRHEEYTCYLVMTQKITRTLLGLEELQWLNIIISYLAVSLENVYLMRKLTLKLYQLAAEIPNEQGGEDFVWFRKSMFELQEKERNRIANDLHDSTMQDIMFVKRRIEPLLAYFPETSKAHGQIDSAIRHLELINENLRQSLFELHPFLLQRVGLIESIRKMVEMEDGLNDFEIAFLPVRAEALENLHLDEKTHLFRIIQELINNAKKHSHASRLSLVLGSEADGYYVHYEDDGVGFEAQALAADGREGQGLSGLGLEQMKSRILHLNGRFEMDARRGQGVKLHIRIPMKEGVSA